MRAETWDDRAGWVRQAWATGAMALVFVAGFTMQLVVGRSSFDAPAVVHLHALIFFGWVALNLMQAATAAGGRLALHRRLGWLAALWVPAMLVAGLMVTLHTIGEGRVPFFFQPQVFLFQNPSVLLCFAALTGAAIVLRRDTGWHRRLHLCSLAVLMGPAFGRLLPMPFLMPVAWEVAAIPGLLFPGWLAWAEWRRTGELHPAWPVGLAALPLMAAAATMLAHSAAGDALYAAAIAGHPAARADGLAFGPWPPGL